MELGGPDYRKSAPKITDYEGNEITDPQGMGYRYFGAAKNLPGVKELFEKEPPKKVKRTRQDLYRNIDGDYYGFRDEDDGVLIQVESEAEEQLRKKALTEWKHDLDSKYTQVVPSGSTSQPTSIEAPPEASFVAFVPLPDEKEIEKQVLAKRKADLLSLYTSETLQEKQEEARSLLHKK